MSHALVLSLLAAASLAPDRLPPRLQAARTAAAPDVDGRLDDPAWQAAPASEAFTQKFPDDGAVPSERTRVRVLYDDRALYVGIECDQRSAPLVRRMARRDREVDTDRVSVAISSRRDGQTAFRFDVTADGVLADGIYYDDEEFSRAWDENWEAETSIAGDGRGWSAELRIPLRILRFEALPMQDWGLNVKRFITARGEITEWAYSPRTEAGIVSRFGRLENLEGLRPRHDLELRPFVLGKVTRTDPGFGPRVGFGHQASAGLDAKWHPTQDLTLDATLNPDFGQVEADEVVLNLTTFETSHPEKRPFFLEGTDTFATPRRVLYTRRIGRAPGAPARLPGEIAGDSPQPSPIWGALKLVGRPAGRLSLGALSALTGPNETPVVDAQGGSYARVADPATAYNVLRVKQDLGDRGYLGLIGTATNRFERPRDYPALTDDALTLCPTGARVIPGARCFRDAYVGGVDGRWRSPGGSYAASGQAVASMIDEGPTRVLRDGTTIGSGDTGSLASVRVAKEGGEHWLWEAGSSYASRQVDINDLGFLDRQNLWTGGLEIGYRTTRPWWVTLETESELDLSQATNLDGLDLGRWASLRSDFTLRNLWEVELDGSYGWSSFDDREIGDGSAVERSRRFRLGVELRSDPRMPVGTGIESSAVLLPGGGRQYRAEGSLRLRAFPRLELDLRPEVSHRHGEPRFLEREDLGDGRTQYLFGDLRATGVGVTLRSTYTFTPRLTLQAYAQLFLAAKHFDGFSAATSAGPRPVLRLAELAPVEAPADNPDGQDAVLNASVLLRWEYRLGSVIYLVYTRSQRPRLELMPGDEARLDPMLVPRAPAADALLVKLSYWWS